SSWVAPKVSDWLSSLIVERDGKFYPKAANEKVDDEPLPNESDACPETGEYDCTKCSGEFCETHGVSPCDCDTAERHEKPATANTDDEAGFDASMQAMGFVPVKHEAAGDAGESSCSSPAESQDTPAVASDPKYKINVTAEQAARPDMDDSGCDVTAGVSEPAKSEAWLQHQLVAAEKRAAESDLRRCETIAMCDQLK